MADCNEVDHGDVDQGEDWVFHHCAGLDDIPSWLVFTDSARAQIGFGRVANVTGFFDIDRDDAWPIDWRGQVRNGRFEPHAVIIRMPLLESDATELMVFRLRPDGTSCIVGSTFDSNEARQIADASLGKFKCLQEPYLP